MLTRAWRRFWRLPCLSSMDVIHGHYSWIPSMDIILGYHPWISSLARSLGRSLARSLGRSLGRPPARPLARSLARPLARSPAQYVYVFIKNTRQNIFSGGTVKETSCANIFFLSSETFPQPVILGRGGEFFNLT